MATKTLTIKGSGGISVTNSGTTITIDGSSVSGSGGNGLAGGYGICSTAAGTAAKAVNIDGISESLATGVRAIVQFSYTNTAAAAMTLNVSNTGAKGVRYRGSIIVSEAIRAGYIYEFIYDGTYWQCITPLIWTD